MNDIKTTCTEVEGLLPLYVGGDLEKDQMDFVAGHLQGCTDCAESFSRSREARGLLRTELIDLVDGREPQLWPALREQLQAEGLFKQTAIGVPDGGAQSSPSKLEPAAALAPVLTHPRWRRTAGLAAGVAAVLFLGKMAPFGGDASQGPTDRSGSPAVAGGDSVSPEVGRGFQGAVASNGAVALDLSADNLLAGASAPISPEADSMGTPMEETGGLRPIGFDEQSLGDIARDNLRREREAGQMFFLTAPSPNTTRDSGVGLVSSYSLQ
ncbi:MAG: hypothetical protein ACJAZ8_002276 [Planctomycetota bacterium]|jgi:hypothetical protein